MTTKNSQRALPFPGRRTAVGPAWVTPSAWVLLAAGGVAIAAFTFLLHRGDPEGAARIANAEIEASLERDEVVLERVAVRQRYWWDYYRQTHGVLAATNRRLLYVGVPPEPLLRGVDGPPELMQASFPYSRPLVVDSGRIFLGTARGVIFAGPTSSETFAVAEHELPRLKAVLTVVTAKLDTLRMVADAERRATDAAAAAARRPIYHLVQRGEALEVIARRYGVEVDSLRAWNSLTDSRIRVGSRLLVRPGR